MKRFLTMIINKKLKILIPVALIVLSFVIITLFKNSGGRVPKHIILISIDTCRADHLSCYGYKHNTTPNIDAVAEEGILFENTISPVPLTLPSHASIMTGKISFEENRS